MQNYTVIGGPQCWRELPIWSSPSPPPQSPTYQTFNGRTELPETRRWFTCRERVANGRNQAAKLTGRSTPLSGGVDIHQN